MTIESAAREMPRDPVSIVAGIVIGLLVLSPLSAQAQNAPVGDPGRGYAFALKNCASCHAVGRYATTPAKPMAPTFISIARTRGMTAMALRAALQTSHQSMPNLVIRGRNRDDVIAYILSLKPADPSTPD